MIFTHESLWSPEAEPVLYLVEKPYLSAGMIIFIRKIPIQSKVVSSIFQSYGGWENGETPVG
ncbi:hypothetical protein HLI_15985 [Halobacillus litoralis]|uniref:Uncharacterized protein n=1 Tax=Halobacillus litoralis TaxID=45668 RepID=A0A410MG03_9BACI|nr:hypothetical protein HLI_15985 [Halobacillus litoralis]